VAATRNASRYQTPLAILRLTGRAVLDALGGLVGRRPLLVPLAGEPGTVAILTTPDGRDGDRALNPGNQYADWRQAVAARGVLRLGSYRPGRAASRVRCPLLVVVADQDQSALAEPAVRAAGQAPGELARLPGGHYAPFLEQHEATVEVELSFLQRHLAHIWTGPCRGINDRIRHVNEGINYAFLYRAFGADGRARIRPARAPGITYLSAG
jgi:uncharacterized protein